MVVVGEDRRSCVGGCDASGGKHDDSDDKS